MTFTPEEGAEIFKRDAMGRVRLLAQTCAEGWVAYGTSKSFPKSQTISGSFRADFDRKERSGDQERRSQGQHFLIRLNPELYQEAMLCSF